MLLASAEPQLRWNLLDDVRQLLEFPFMVNALRAGTVVAVMAGAIGWFMVLRRQTFAGHTLAVIGFPGGAGAIWLGLSAQLGFFAFCGAGALVIAASPQRRSEFGEQTAVIATTQAFALGLGFWFISLYAGNLNGTNTLLFGSVLGVTADDVVRVAVIGVAVLLTLAVIGRPLLFASVDEDVAAARDVPVRALSIIFFLTLGLVAAAAAQITGALLVFAMLVLPPATAQVLTARAGRGLALSVALGVLITWVGLGIAYFSPYPVGFWITTIAFGLFVVVKVGATLVRRGTRSP